MAPAPLPPELGQLAERETWLSQDNAERVFDWLAGQDTRLLGVETARKLPDGQWVLLTDPMLDSSGESDPTASVQQGRDFIARHSEPALMFEPVWADD